MIKLLIVDDKNKDSLILKSIKKFLENKSYRYVGWNPTDILKTESPNFVFFDLRESVNGDNVVNMMQGFDVYSRLRITIIYPLKLRIRTVKEIFTPIYNMFRRKEPRKLNEAYSRR